MIKEKSNLIMIYYSFIGGTFESFSSINSIYILLLNLQNTGIYIFFKLKVQGEKNNNVYLST